MTSRELYDKLSPCKTEKVMCQITDRGLNINTSDLFTRLIKDAARCNRYSSDVYYSLVEIDDAFYYYDPEKPIEPIWIAFRKDGVDHTSFVLSRIDDDKYKIYREYFALYSVVVENDEHGFVNVYFNEYAV